MLIKAFKKELQITDPFYLILIILKMLKLIRKEKGFPLLSC